MWMDLGGIETESCTIFLWPLNLSWNQERSYMATSLFIARNETENIKSQIVKALAEEAIHPKGRVMIA